MVWVAFVHIDILVSVELHALLCSATRYSHLVHSGILALCLSRVFKFSFLFAPLTYRHIVIAVFDMETYEIPFDHSVADRPMS